MMTLDQSRFGFLVAADGLDESEILEPVRFLTQAGAHVDLVARGNVSVQLLRRCPEGVKEKVAIRADRTLDEITPLSYDALLLPASAFRAGHLAVPSDMRDFIRRAKSAGKPIVWLPGAPAARRAGGEAARVDLKRLLRDSFVNWYTINAPRMGASLAYYTVLSLAPLLVVAVAIAGLVYGKKIVEAQVITQIRDLIGQRGADSIRVMLETARQPAAGIIATVLGVLALLFSASGVFLELRDSLNGVWGAKPGYGSTLVSLIKQRSYSFLMVLGTGLLLLVSLALSALLASVGRFLTGILPIPPFALYPAAFLVSFSVFTLVFALIYKVIPDVRISWRDVWIGAAVTSLLFTSGKTVIGFYLARAAVGSAYGAAGSLLVILVWVYYSAQVFLLGAEFTYVYARRHGSHSAKAREDRISRFLHGGQRRAS